MPENCGTQRLLASPNRVVHNLVQVSGQVWFICPRTSGITSPHKMAFCGDPERTILNARAPTSHPASNEKYKKRKSELLHASVFLREGKARREGVGIYLENKLDEKFN